MAPSLPRNRGHRRPRSVAPMALAALVALAACAPGRQGDTGPDAAVAVPRGDTPPTASVAGPDGGGDEAAELVATTIAPAPTGDGDGPSGGGAADRPPWLGRRTLPTTADGRVVTPQTTPAELRDRRLVTVDTLPAPLDERFTATVGPVPDEVLARSTWSEACPVAAGDLRYLTLSFWGFDGDHHTGEMIVDASVADDVVSVFRALHEARFPLEEMRVVSPDDLLAEPTGDTNNTTAFVCRPVTGGTRFSEHARGLAIDINPFHNPYVRDDLVLPELAGHYLDRSLGATGMVGEGDVVVRAFEAIGWSWGGRWRSLKDYQHFSRHDR